MMPSNRLPLAASVAVLAATAATAQKPVPLGGHQELFDPQRVEALDLRCATPVFDGSLFAEAPSDCGYNSTTISSAYDPTSTLEIEVVFHVIQRTDGTGALSVAQVQSQIDVLNEDFRALAGTNGAGGFDTLIQFKLADTDPQGNPTNGITFSTNNTWYNDGGSYWNTLAWDTDRYLNIYSNSAAGALGYVPGLPQSGGLVGTNADRVVAYWASVGKNAPFFPYHQGRTVTHEVGHYLGLFHTFDFGCGVSGQPGCFSSGDRVCDTNAENSPRYGCPNASSCGSSDPITNYMDYTDDLCMTGFTAQQSNRMRCTIENWRPQLASSCGSVAAASTRNAGTNPLSLTSNAPVGGGELVLQVDLSTTGHSQAAVVAFRTPLEVVLGAGQTLLTNIADPAGELLGLPVKSGPTAVWGLPVAPGICGEGMTVQAVHFGSVFPFALSNARDLTIGL